MTLKHKKFVAALTTPKSPSYCKPSASYRAASPNVKDNSSWTGASRLLRNSEVAAAVSEQLSLEELGDELKLCLRETKKLKQWDSARATVMDYAKLTGKIVDRQEIKTITDADTSAVRDMVKASMRVDSDARTVPPTVGNG